MANLIQPDTVRKIFPRVDPDITDDSLASACGTASRRIHAWVGEDVYADAILRTPTNPDRASDLKLAGSYLAMSILLAVFGTVVRPEGIMISEKSEQGNSQTRYFTPADTQSRSEELFRLAEKTAAPYIIAIPEIVAATVDGAIINESKTN